LRRNDKKITDPDILTGILQQSPVAHLAMAENNQPYCIPVNFAYHNEKIYLHCAVEGKKLDIIKANTIVSFQTEMFTSFTEGENPCSAGMKYVSVNCSGKASITDSFEKIDSILEIISHKYMKGDRFNFSREQVLATRCICIDINTISGKISGYTIPEILKKLNLQ